MLGILIYEREQWVFGFVRTKKLKLHDWNEAIGHIRDPGLAITQYWPRWNMTHIQAWPHAQPQARPITGRLAGHVTPADQSRARAGSWLASEDPTAIRAEHLNKAAYGEPKIVNGGWYNIVTS